VIVTGSRIVRAGFDTLQAALVTSSQEIQQRGYTNVAEALNETPIFTPSDVSPINTNQGTFGAGQSFVDMFGLGSQRTLTLVNGRRFVTSNTVAGSGNAGAPGQQVDLNVIPIGLVERVETIAIGGAPVYGADAIAGTVNIILKDDFEGLQLEAQYGDNEKGDAHGYSVRALMGGNFGDGRGNAVLGVEYNKQDGIVLGRRTGLHYNLPNPNAPPARFVNTDLVYSAMTEGGLPYNLALGYITDANGTPLQFAPDGSLVPFVPGADADGLPFDVISIGGDGVRMADHFSLLSPTERVLLNGIAHYDVAPWARAFVEASYARSEGTELSEVAAFASPLLSGTWLTFDVNNPFLRPEVRDTLQANGITGPFMMARNFSDLLDRGGLSTTTIDLFRVVVGLEGDFYAFGEKMSWDISYNHGRSRGTSELKYINETRLLAAMDAVLDPDTQEIVCASGGDCVPINLFGENAFSDAAAAYVLDPASAVSENTQRVITANLGGRLPFGIGRADPIAFNLGTEFRREHGSFEPDALLRQGNSLLGLSIASPYVPTSGGFKTEEYYAEVVTPLVSPGQQMRGIKALSLEGAVRYVDNSIAGGDTTWSTGLRFSPRLPAWGDGLTFRAVYMESIRAPAITELFSGAVPTRGGIADPCDASRYNQGNNPEVRAANCAAELAALGYASPADFHATTFGLSPLGTTSGNPNLANEKAKSWSVGLVYQPTALPDFRMALDWSDIDLRDGIESLSINSLLAACYDNPNFPDVAACNAFRRLDPSEVGTGTPNPTRVAGDIANGYNSGYINTASLHFAGLIFTTEYTLRLGDLVPSWESAGSLRLRGKVFYRDKYESVTLPGELAVNIVGEDGVPRYSGQFSIGYERDRFDVLLQGLWTSSVKLDLTADSSVIDPKFNELDDYWKFNGTLGYRVTDNTRAQLVVNNLFNNRASPSQILSGKVGTYDLLGRVYMVTLRANF